MSQNLDALTARFDSALLRMMQNLGPQLIARMQINLTPGQVFMLHFIRQDSQCSLSKLAEKMEVAPSAITVMVDRLENRGFVVRVRDKADRRVVVVQLTETGEQALDHVLNVRKQIMQHCLTQIQFEELESFIQTLEKLTIISDSMDMTTITGLDHGLEV